MLVFDVEQVKKYNIRKKDVSAPSLAMAKNGRLFASYIAGGETVVMRSDDEAKSWSTVAIAKANEGESVFDSRVWIDPLGRLWLMWSVIPNNRVECCICNDPCADMLAWGEVRTLDFGLTLARPIVLNSGAWLFVSGVTNRELAARAPSDEGGKAKGIYLYQTLDGGETFTQINKPVGSSTTFDSLSVIEKVIFSRPDGVNIESKYFVVVYAQVAYGIAKFISPDGGVSFRAENDSAYGSYDSQFDVSTIGPIAEKKFMLVNNAHFGEGGKMCLCALISNSRGDSYQGILEIQAPDCQAYSPDIAVCDGHFLVAYARAVADGEREIALARFTEEDVLAGALVNDKSFVGRIIE